MQVHLQVGNAIQQIRGAFHRSIVYAVFDQKRLKQRPLRNRLAYDRVRPRHRLAVRVQPRGKAVVPHRPVPAAL